MLTNPIVSTAVFSTCGMSVWTFIISAFLSLPKQFITVYLGVALEQSDKGGGSTSDKIIKDVVLAVTVIITFLAMWYIYRLMNQAKPDVIYARRKARSVHRVEMYTCADAFGAGRQSSRPRALPPMATVRCSSQTLLLHSTPQPMRARSRSPLILRLSAPLPISNGTRTAVPSDMQATRRSTSLNPAVQHLSGRSPRRRHTDRRGSARTQA